jgi:hypothetical protein
VQTPVEHGVPSSAACDCVQIAGSLGDAHSPTPTQRRRITSAKDTHSVESAAHETLPQRGSSSLPGS